MKGAPGTTDTPLRLSVREENLAICRLSPDQEIPAWAMEADFFSITRTQNEVAIVCPEPVIPADLMCERGWRALEVEGPLDFSLVGVLAAITKPLAEAGVSIFAISTYDTDYVLVKENVLNTAVAALRGAGHEVQRDQSTGVIIRSADAGDEPFLWEMLYEAVHWSSEETATKPPPEELLSEPNLRHYLEGWGRENDFAVVARDVEDGERVGAAWYRLFPASDPGYGFVDATTPDIAIAVSPKRRGTGVGGALLHALKDAARLDGFDAISLSVQKSNLAAIKLYERESFVRLRDDGDAWTMEADLSTGPTTNRPQSTEERCR